jgi:hypothetical protein
LESTSCSDYGALYQELFQLDFRQLSEQAAEVLEKTDDVYSSRLNERLETDLGVTLGEAERHDTLFLLHTTRYDGLFPAGDLLRVYRDTMNGLGIDVERQQNIDIDSATRPRKTLRAFCAPIMVPDEIKLVIRPTGGQTDYLTLLHEAGHAQHYGWTSPELRPEFRYTGDYALSETYAFLFNHLPCETAWLGSLLGARASRDLTVSMLLARLITIRRYAAKLIYECELHSLDDPSNAGPLYSETQSSATGFKTSETEYLYDLDDSFYSASYLRAWAFEVLLREYLKTRFGSRWWQSRRAGGFLKEIWETGDRYTACEMAAQIGLGQIGFQPLIDEFVSRLSTNGNEELTVAR